MQNTEGTVVYAPEKSKVVFVDSCSLNEDRNMVDVYLYSAQSGIAYVLEHLDADSVPGHLKELQLYDANSKLILQKGELVGKIAQWFPFGVEDDPCTELDEDVQVPPAVEKVHQRAYNHVHIATSYVQPSELRRVNSAREFGKPTTTRGSLVRLMNPLLVFRRLYDDNSIRDT